MTTYDELRTYIKEELNANADFSLTIEDFIKIGNSLAFEITNVDPCDITRLHFLLDNKRDSRYICFSTEAVAFGMLDSSQGEPIASRRHVVKFMSALGFKDIDNYDILREQKTVTSLRRSASRSGWHIIITRTNHSHI